MTQAHGTNFGLRANYYPPMSGDQDRSGAGRLLGPRGRRPVHDPAGDPGRGPAGVEPPQRQMGAPRRAAGLDHHQHRRLHAADQQRPAAVDHPPRRQAPRRIASHRGAGVLPDRRLCLGGRDARGAARPRPNPDTSRSRRSPSTRAAPANSTATIMRWAPRGPGRRCPSPWRPASSGCPGNGRR
jgi:hypothetical protein